MMADLQRHSLRGLVSAPAAGSSWRALGTKVGVVVLGAGAHEAARRAIEAELAAIDAACAELFPQRLQLDDWGSPMLDEAPLPDDLLAHARRAVAGCPTLALRLGTGGRTT